jgi:hypothetical protein
MTLKRFYRLQERYGDPLVTALTLMLAILLFVVGPLQAAGEAEAHHFGIAFSFVMLAAVLIVSKSVVAVGAILLAIALIVCAGVLRSQHPSGVDICLDATAWMIFGITLGIVVARAVFAPGRITFHRIIGAILLYLCIGLVFVSFYCFVALRELNAFSGLPRFRTISLPPET